MNDYDSIGLHSIHLCGVHCHLLVAGGEAVMIDTGFVGEVPLIGAKLRRLGLGYRSIRAILLTHGHLDHTGNLSRLAALTGAPVYAHEAERLHVEGTYPYEGTARWCGRLERAGRLLLRYRSAPIDRHFRDGEELPFWGGLRVVHLPGHTKGHCGFHSARHDLLFSGDLFASYWFKTHLPAPILNTQPELFVESFARVAALNPSRIVPNHYDRLDGRLHRRRFDRLMARLEAPAILPA